MSQSEVIPQRAVFLLASRGKGGGGRGRGGKERGRRTGVFLRGKLYAERINGQVSETMVLRQKGY